jgi:hypothetical protein
MAFVRSILISLVVFAAALGVFAQDSPAVKSQEVSDTDGIPVLLKHLPDWENVKDRAQLIQDQDGLKTAIGTRPVADAIDFTGGTEAATAQYSQGRLLIVESTNPQAATDTDAKIQANLASIPQVGTFYRRIGNYSVFVFDAADEAAASGLLDQVKYEKSVQWLDKDPYYLKKVEQVFIFTTTNMLVGSVFVVVGGVIGSAIVGLIVGYIYFLISSRRRLAWTAYSDSGGLTRLNLDDLSEPISPK